MLSGLLPFFNLFWITSFIKGNALTDNLCFFDVCCVFTCVLHETIDIWTDLLYRSYLSPTQIPENIFIELIKFATISVEFNCDNIMYRLMGSRWSLLLGLVLANILAGVNEKGLVASPNKPVVYFRYIDYTFCLFNNETVADMVF